MSELETDNRSEACGFCGERLEALAVLVRGRFTAICSDCLETALSIMRELPENEVTRLFRSAEPCAMCAGRGASVRSEFGAQPAICLTCIGLATECVQEHQGTAVDEVALAWLSGELKRQKRARRRERWSRLAGLFGIRSR